MKRPIAKILILLLLVGLGLLAWHFDLFRAGDCLMEGGRWNLGGGFCRLDDMTPAIVQAPAP